MQHILFAAMAALTVSMTSVASAAEEYDFEIGLTFDNASMDFYSPAVAIGGIPDPSLRLSTGTGETDTFSLLGTWYFQGLADVDGPRSRAAFLNRASSLSFGYAHDDEDNTASLTGSLFPPRFSTSKTSRHAFNVDLRYVVPDSGWYGLAGISRIDTDTRFQTNGTPFSYSFDSMDYRLGLGKYVGESTAVSLTLGSSQSDGFDRSATSMSLSLTHIGSLGSNWKYGADIGVSKSDLTIDDGTYALGLSLYPSRNLEFGTRISHQAFDAGPNKSTYEGFASWFVRDNIEISGRFASEDTDRYFGTDVDGYSGGVGVSVRF